MPLGEGGVLVGSGIKTPLIKTGFYIILIKEIKDDGTNTEKRI